MNRRDFALLLPAAALLAGCDSDQKSAAAATLLNSSGVQDALKAMDNAIVVLDSQVVRFDDGNWRSVVPAVESASASVRSAFEDLQRTLGVTE
jgi:hypothetical protein